MQDLRYAVRRLLKSPGFSLIAIATLAIGIGANSAIFSVVNAVLLKPLPYPEPDRLVGLYHVQDGQRTTMSGPNFIDATSRAKSLENAAATHSERVVLTGAGDPVRLEAAEVSASLFNVLRIRPILGRTFNADEDTPGKTNVVVLSYGLWTQRFGGAADVIGQRVQIDGVRTEVIGVMPAGFSFPPDRQAWLPLVYDKAFVSAARGAWYLNVVARLRPGFAPAQAAAEVEAIGQTLARQYPEANANLGMTAVPLHEAIVGDVRRSVLVLLAAVGFVLLIACANVANLLLARSASRESEMAIRAALGAGRGRLVRQLLTESVLLAFAGGAIGLLLAAWGVDLLTSMQPSGVPRLQDVRVDLTVLTFAAGLALVTGIVFGLVPALQASRSGLAGSLKESGRGAGSGHAGARVRGTLVVVETALAVLLLVGAGLLIRSFARLQAVDPGFSTDHTLGFDLTMPDVKYNTDAKRISFFDQLLPQLAALPGVRSTGAAMALPLSGMQFDIGFAVEGRPPVPPADEPSMEMRVASPGYFRTLGIALVRGRLFTEEDREGTTPVLLISESAARRYFPREDPIGHKIHIGWGRKVDGVRRTAGGEVIGIVGDVRDSALSDPVTPVLYLPLRQWPVTTMSVVLNAATSPAALASAISDRVHAIDPGLPVSNVRTLDQIVAKSMSQPRFYTTLLSIFAAVALLLAAVGIFGVLSYAVAQRTREIGIRMALGAQSRTVVTLVVRQAMLLAGGGIVAGSSAAAFLTQALAKMLFDVKPTDPATFVAGAVLLMTVALLASYLPARRAARVDPIVALRAE